MIEPLSFLRGDSKVGHEGVMSLQKPTVSGGLSGKRVVITRAQNQSDTLVALLREAGAQPLFYPSIDIAPPEDSAPLDQALRQIGAFDWLIVTSANTVRALADRFVALGVPFSALQHLRIAAVGPATANAARELLGIEAVVPSEHEAQPADGARAHRHRGTSANSDEYNADALARRLHLPGGSRVLLPQSEIASPLLADLLAQRGADVQIVTAYRTVRGSGGDPVPQLLAQGEVDAVIFTSGSTVRYFVERVAAEGGSNSDLARVVIACIGTSTAHAARHAGLTATVVPPISTLPALVRSLEAHFDVR